MLERIRNFFKRVEPVNAQDLYFSILRNKEEEILSDDDRILYFMYRGYNGRISVKGIGLIVELQMGKANVGFLIAPKRHTMIGMPDRENQASLFNWKWLDRPNPTHATILNLAI